MCVCVFVCVCLCVCVCKCICVCVCVHGYLPLLPALRIVTITRKQREREGGGERPDSQVFRAVYAACQAMVSVGGARGAMYI